MHKLIEYVCDELDSIEKKAEKGNLTMSEIEYADKLAHLKKNLLKGEKLYDEMDDGYSGMSYRKRDSRGRYSSERGYSREGMADTLRSMMYRAPEEYKHDFERLADKMERM